MGRGLSSWTPRHEIEGEGKEILLCKTLSLQTQFMPKPLPATLIYNYTTIIVT